MKIFEVAGEGKLHGLTVMSLDKFVKKEDDIEEQIDEIDRRGFLKGLGAAAAAGMAGAAGGAMAQQKSKLDIERERNMAIVNTPKSNLELERERNMAIVNKGSRPASPQPAPEYASKPKNKKSDDTNWTAILTGTATGMYLLRQWNRGPQEGSIFKVFVNGKDVSNKLLTKPEAIEVIGKLVGQEHDIKTQFTIYNTKLEKIIFRKIWSDAGDYPGWIDTNESVNQGVAEDSSQKTFTVVYYSKKTDRNVTKNIKATNQSQVWDQLKLKGIDVVSVKEQGITEDVSTDAKVYQNKMTGKFIAWVEINKKQFKQEGDTKEEALQNLIDQVDSLKASRKDALSKWTIVGFTAGFVSLIKMNKFFAKFSNGKLLISDQPGPGYSLVTMSGKQVSPTGKFAVSDIQNAGLDISARYDIKSTGEDGVFVLKHHSDVLGTWDTLKRSEPSLTIQMAGRNVAEGLKEFALPGSGDGDSGRWYTDDELADIIGDDWFEDFDVSTDGFNIDTHGEKAKQNLASYANSWFDDKGYNVTVMGVDHNDVDHDLKWYIVGSFQNDNFADKDVEESNSAVIASTADRLSNKDDGRTAKLRAAGDTRREQHLKGRDIAKNDRSSKDAWGNLKEAPGDLKESYQGQFKSKEEAVKYAKERVKTLRDKEDGIEVWAMPNGSFDVNHTMNSNGRNHIVDNGGKKVGTISAGSLSEAPGEFGLGANYRAVPDDEMQDLMGRSKNKTKTKRDKFDYPYIHGSNIEVKDEAGKTFNAEKLRAAIMTRPERILGQNAKFQHSETGTEAVFSIGLPALKGLAVNEKTGEFVVVDTCPGAGACQTYCYAMKGSYVMFKAVSMALARMLNFLLNDPAGFVSQLNSEIASARSKYAKKGARIVIRWHEAGDFFSNEYLDVAYKVAEANPDVGFYAYTKMGDVANAARPKNFNMNFSQGAKSSQEKKVNITRTKHSKVVPKEMFFDLIARKGNELIKDAKGRMQFASPENLDKFKTIMAQKYAIDKDSILTYDQIMKTPIGDTPKWNVFVMPGDGDNSANRNDVIGTYLLFH